MFRKGKREILIKIVLLPYAKPALIYNPSVAGYHEGAENQSLIKKGIKTVRPNHGIIIKYESPKGAHSSVLSSYNIGFRRNDDLVSLADYIVALHIDNVSYLPQTSVVRMLNPEMPEAGIDTMPSAELPTMEIDGDIFTFQGRSYNVMTNPVPNGHCFWSLLLTFYSIPEQLLEEVAGQCRINYNDYVEPEQLEELIDAINRRLPLEEQLRVQLDVFYYTGERDNVRSRTYGSGLKCICVGLVCAPDGYGHFIPSCPGK